MHYKVILRILGILLMIFSITMLPPVAIAYAYNDGLEVAFLSGFLITLLHRVYHLGTGIPGTPGPAHQRRISYYCAVLGGTGPVRGFPIHAGR